MLRFSIVLHWLLFAMVLICRLTLNDSCGTKKTLIQTSHLTNYVLNVCADVPDIASYLSDLLNTCDFTRQEGDIAFADCFSSCIRFETCCAMSYSLYDGCHLCLEDSSSINVNNISTDFVALEKLVEYKNSVFNECESTPCQNNGACVDGLLQFQCSCGVQYMGSVCETELENVAVGHPAQLSSLQDNNGLAHFAVDGNYSPVWIHRSCASTYGYGSVDPWWAVDLESSRTVHGVSVTNRGDCCPERLHDFDTYVSSDTMSPLTSVDKQLCASFAGEVGAGITVDLICSELLIGRYFSVIIPGDGNVVTLCEVAVYGI